MDSGDCRVNAKRAIGMANNTKNNRKAAFVDFRLPAQIIKSVGHWGKQNGINRSHALRELIEQALKSPQR